MPKYEYMPYVANEAVHHESMSNFPEYLIYRFCFHPKKTVTERVFKMWKEDLRVKAIDHRPALEKKFKKYKVYWFK